jgi:formylglycine-generating enzyme required for sulfatase activity/tRNA A-37 threonylcarbamoyl transferase component Bud32
MVRSRHVSRLVTLTPGSIFAGEFRVVRPLAEGGMGAVYEVEQVHTGAARALKIMHPQLVNDDKLRARFVQEARVSALIESDHVVQVVGAGVDAETGAPWLAMELLKGETLAAFLHRRGALATWEVREIFSQLCHALIAAHEGGVVHRDLKPENIFLGVPRREGVSFTVKVLDFGIAKLVAEANQTHTAAIGTPLWMAPEQTETGTAVRPATDVWALGLLAFHCLTGMHYWRAANFGRISAAALLREVVLDPLVAASDRASEYGRGDRIPPGFDGFFARCVVRDLDGRYASAREVRDAIDALFAVATSAPLGIAPLGYAGGMTPIAITPLPQLNELGATVAAPPRPQVVITPPHAPGTGEPTVDEGAQPLPVHATSRTGLFVVASALLLGAGAIGLVAHKGNQAPSQPTGPATADARASSSAFDVPKASPKRCPPAMAQIPGGTFFMSSKGDHATVNPYCLDVHEVKVSDFTDCVKRGNCSDAGASASEPFCNYGVKSKAGHPVNCVDWDQAAAYCHAASKRLPTMEEWEWAARDGEAGHTFPWGDDAPNDQLCWSGSLRRTALGTCEVGSHPSGAGRLLVQDLAGNVAEWVDAAPGTHESVRPLLGDHWLNETPSFAKDLSGRTSVATRLVARKLHQATIGFRCAMTPS